MDQTPWLVPGAVAWLDQKVEPEWRGWEWGAGGSTVWLARRLGRLTTIEHEANWVAEVGQRLVKFNLPNVDLRHIGWSTGNAAQYTDAILAEPDNSLSLVLVDGRSRVRCVTNAIAKVAPGGLLIVDDTNRDYYQEGTNLIPPEWTRYDFEGEWNGRWVTSVWVRP